jgi:DNA-binding protein HU-beta
MNRTDLSAALATRLNISKKQATEIVGALFDGDTGIIAETLAKGESVALQGFGLFKVSQRAARTGSNPMTGVPISIPAKKSPKFSAGKVLKDTVK